MLEIYRHRVGLQMEPAFVTYESGAMEIIKRLVGRERI